MLGERHAVCDCVVSHEREGGVVRGVDQDSPDEWRVGRVERRAHLLRNLGFPSRLGIAVNDPQRYWRGIRLTKPRNGARLALNRSRQQRVTLSEAGERLTPISHARFSRNLRSHRKMERAILVAQPEQVL